MIDKKIEYCIMTAEGGRFTYGTLASARADAPDWPGSKVQARAVVTETGEWANVEFVEDPKVEMP